MKRIALAALAGSVSLLAAASPAQAFCGFYVAPTDQPLTADATMVALMREGTRTVISMSNNYKGPAADFAMVVPVPVVLHEADVKTLPRDVFTHLEALSAPRLVEYWEQDPCPPPREYDREENAPMSGAMPAPPQPVAASKSDGDYGVKVEAKFSVGEYQVVVLGAKESDGLESWLRDNGYKIPNGASSALAPYVAEQQKFFVARVDIKKVTRDAQGVAVLSPLRFSYESKDFRLPVRLGLLNAPTAGGGADAPRQDLIVYVLAKERRYEVANYPNVYVPTNLEVRDETRASFQPFYAALFDASVARWGGKGIVTEYAWQSSSCDPCPTPPLDDGDVATLGGDVLFQGSPGYGMVLTRLHARYDAKTLSEDLVFRGAEPIVGGREMVVDANGGIEKGAQPAAENNFQARYVIRHAWTGAIACDHPQRGVWGGPPGGGVAAPLAATNLASAPRGGVALGDYLKDSTVDFIVVPPVARDHHACGCDVPGGRATGAGAAAVGLGAIALLWSRRRRSVT